MSSASKTSTLPNSVHQLSPEEVKEELQYFLNEQGFIRPARSAVDPSRPWQNGVPNYDKADLLFFRGKTANHAATSLEMVVENAVKNWEMEATHLDYKDWTCHDPSSYKVSANGGKVFVGEEGARVGNYNWLMASCDKSLYDSEKETFESSHQKFGQAFLGGFPWEVLKVFSGPPKVAFSWRHWATFEGSYEGREGDEKTYELYGFAVVALNAELKIKEIEVFYKPDDFMKALHGSIPPEDLNVGKSLIGSGCPFLSSRS